MGGHFIAPRFGMAFIWWKISPRSLRNERGIMKLCLECNDNERLRMRAEACGSR